MSRSVAGLRWLVAALGLAGIVTLYHHWQHVNPTTVALTLLLFILLLGANWGLRYAFAASLAATACYNFFFLPPVGTFTIVDPQNWLALFAFLFTSVVASRLSARVREEATEAKRTQREVEVLFTLSRELLQTENVADLLNSAPQTIAHVSGASSVDLFLAEQDRAYSSDPFADQSNIEQLRSLANITTVTALEPPRGVAVPLRSGVRPRGVLVLRGLEVSDATLASIAGLVSISIDRAQALEEVTRSEAAKSSERLRSMMLDSITHELRTPLTAIKVSATTLLSAGQMPEDDQRDLLTVINEESDRLNHLIAQAVEMAQLDTHEVHMSVGPQSVAALIEHSIAACESAISGSRIEVRVEPELPLVQADPAWIQKVIGNLLENAVKYSSEARSDAPVTVVAAASQRLSASAVAMVSISVADRGIGIHPSEQSLIFDKFYRARTRPRQVPGTGMGLAICRAIVEAHGGTIEVVSEPDKGSVFTFYLPVAADQARRRR